MTAQERVSIERLNKKFDLFIEEDTKWKANVAEQLQPLVEERIDRLIIQKYGVITFRALAAFIGFLVSIGMFVKYVLGPLLGWTKL